MATLQPCLFIPFQVITTANNTLNGISSSTVCTEVIQSAQGMEYLLGETTITIILYLLIRDQHYPS